VNRTTSSTVLQKYEFAHRAQDTVPPNNRDSGDRAGPHSYIFDRNSQEPKRDIARGDRVRDHGEPVFLVARQTPADNCIHLGHAVGEASTPTSPRCTASRNAAKRWDYSSDTRNKIGPSGDGRPGGEPSGGLWMAARS